VHMDEDVIAADARGVEKRILGLEATS